MNIYYLTPYAQDRKLGAAYNQSCSIVPDDSDWICLRDGDTMFLNFDWGDIIANAINNHSHIYSAFTCYASRIGGIAQQYENIISEDSDILNHREIALKNASLNAGKVKDISLTPFISGHFILFPKWLWNKVKFMEKTNQGTFLGIDNNFFHHVRVKGYKIGLIEDLYMFHYYRLKEGRDYNKHLT